MATATEPTNPTLPVDTSVDNSADPFAAQREGSDNPFGSGEKGPEEAISTEEGKDGLPSPGEGTKVRRMSKEWDASKVPPSQFQKRKGSVYATPSSRDSHSGTGGGERDKAYFEKLKEKGWNVLKKK